MPAAPRETWGSGFGFVLAAVGSAVGLGNMWRFSYLTAEHGGAVFLLLYGLMVLLVGWPVLLAELTIGRGASRSPMGALARFGGEAWTGLGVVFVIVGCVFLAYYSVIAGWTARYALESLTGFPAISPSDYFAAASEGADAAAWHLGFMVLTIAVVSGGIRAGIERAVRVLMPTLFFTLIGLSLYAATLEGSTAGYRFYLQPDWSKIGSLDVWSAAAGQAFFSLSVGMGAMMTYASYLSERDNLPRQSAMIAGADFAVAFIAGLVVFPLLFALQLQGEIAGGTFGALFVVLPGAFQGMGLAGDILAPVFFIALAVAALTSTISVLELVVASAIDRLGWPRRKAALIAGAGITVAGVAPAFDIGLMAELDAWAGMRLMPAGALVLSLFVGWRMPQPAAKTAVGAPGSAAWLPAWVWLLRIPVPLLLAFILAIQFERLRVLLLGS